MDRAVIDGITLEYEESGAGEPVLCIHGAFIADAFRPLLSERGLTDSCRLICYHRRGYGGSSRSAENADLAELAEDCQRLLLHLGVRRVHVVGHSFGGVIALRLALDAPQLVHTLSLLEVGLLIGDSANPYRQALLRSRERCQVVGAEVAVDEFLRLRWPEYQQHLDNALPGAAEQAVRDAATFFEADLPAGLDFRFGPEEARRVTQPVLLVLGEASVSLDPRFRETYELLLSWLPNAEGFVLPNAAHLLQIQHPRALAEALAEFYGRHPLQEPGRSR